MTTETQHQQTIDWEQCLNLAGNNAEIAEDLITLFVSDLPTVRNYLEKLFLEGDYTMLRDQAHRLHGATCYCGVPHLKAAVQNLEKLLKSKDLRKKISDNSEIKEHLQILLDEIDSVLLTFTKNNFRTQAS